MRRVGLVLLALAAVAGALNGTAHLLTGSSGFARTVAWGEFDIEDRHRFGLGWWVEAGARGGSSRSWPGGSTVRSSPSTQGVTPSWSGLEATTPASTRGPWRSTLPNG